MFRNPLRFNRNNQKPPSGFNPRPVGILLTTCAVWTLSAYLLVDSVHAGAGQQPTAPQAVPAQGTPDHDAQPQQQPAPSEEETFGPTPNAPDSPGISGNQKAISAPWLNGPASEYHTRTASRYNYAFGKDAQFLPSNATTANGEFLNPKTVLTAQYCGHCHQESLHQWRQSAHSNSFRAPWYLKNVNALIDEKGVQFSRHCEGCHNPVALLSGDLSQGMPKKRPFEDEGITCTVCHSITSTTTMGTGSYVMATPAVMVDSDGLRVRGTVPDGEILAHLDRHSKAVMSPLLRSSEFCAACHKAAIPKSLDSYKWLRAMSPYDEWQAASFTKQSPLPFYRKDVVSTCQTCHMIREPLPANSSDYGAKDGKLVSHRWLGANTLLPQYYKFDEQAEKTVAFLRNGVFNVDIFALETEAAKDDPTAAIVAPLGLTSFSVTPGEAITADIVIQNKGAAHSHVPEQRDFYESWVDFLVKDSTGKTLSESGFLQPDGNLDPSAHSFTNRIINDKGEFNDRHQIWHNRVLAYNNTIQSGRSQLIRYRFRIPKDLAGSFTLTATVEYRRFNQHFIDYAMNAKHYPQSVVEMATQTRTITLGQNTPTQPGKEENPQWMRWNNYGIALLDAQQYAASVQAFEKVAALRPTYADAFTNMAIVQIAWEKYDDARPNLTKALSLLPGDPRALYYRALVERNGGQVKEAIADLEAVLVQYPRAKDALRELGFSYYQQRDYPRARALYERIQVIDPDDLAAHYQLAILYRRMGLKEQASYESARFADKKDDPTAAVYALEFLRNHPEVASESVVWHVHDITGEKTQPPVKLPETFMNGGS